MATSELKAALESQQVKGLAKPDPISMPGFGPGLPPNDFDLNKYKVRYARIDFNDVSSIAELEILETKAIRNQGVHILSKDRYNFMDQMFMLVGYLEKDLQE